MKFVNRRNSEFYQNNRPHPVLEILSDKKELLSISTIDPGFFIGASKSRYDELIAPTNGRCFQTPFGPRLQKVRLVEILIGYCQNGDLCILNYGFMRVVH